MRSLVAGSLRFRLMVVLVAAGILALSLAQLRDAPVEVLPEFSPPYVEVQTEALGLSAEEVEELVTVPLEGNLLNSVAGIDVIRSESVLGLSSIVMTFVPGTDILDARQLVQERLTQAHALPNVSEPPTMLQPLSAASRVLMIGLSSKNLSALELGLLARWTIKPRLLGVSGVANVGMWGHRDHQLQVQVDPARLRSHDVTLQQVIRTAGNAQLVSPLTFLEASSPGASGFIDTANQRLQVRHVLPITKPEGLAQVPLDGVPPGTLKLGDVATMVEDHQPLIGDALVGGDAALMLVVEKFPGANTRQVTRDVESALEALRPALTGVEVDPGVFRPATYVEKSIDNLSLALLIGGILMLAVLLALLVEWRLAIVSLVSIALSLSAAAAVLVLRGETISALALAGLALAAVVVIDDVVAAADAVRRRLRERQRSSDADHTEEVLEATLETRRPLTYATLIVVLGVLPLFFLPAPADAFFEPLAVSYALAVLVSMAVALTAAAALTMTLLRRGPLVRGDGPLFPPLARAYGASLDRVAARPHVVYTAIALVAAVGIVLLPRAGVSLLPSFKESELVVQVDGAPGTSRPEMVRVTSQLARELQGLPGVRRVGAHVGRAVMADQVAGMNAGELWISIDPARDHDETVGAIREVVAGYPGLDSGVVTYADEQIRAVGAVVDGNDDRSNTGLDALMGTDQPVAVRLYGNDLGVLRTEAEKVRRALVNVPGVVDPRVERRVVEPIVEIEPDLAAAARYGVKPGDVRRAAAIFVQGIVVGSLFEEQKVFDVVVNGAPATRNSLSSIRALLIDTPSGGHVPLSEVARVRIVPTPTVIKREASSLRIDVVAGIDGRSLGAVLEDVEHTVGGMVFPLEYHADVLGESSDRRAAAVRIAAVAGICLLGIFLLLQAAIGSWRLAAVSLAVAPVAAVGGIVAVHAAGGTISLGSALGLFALFSLVVRSALQLAEHVRRCGREPGVPDPESVLQGSRDRLRPLMTTSLAATALFLPFAVLGDRAGFEIVRPMAIVTLGGLVTMLPFALFVLPVLYRRFGLATAPAATEKVAAPVVLHPGG